MSRSAILMTKAQLDESRIRARRLSWVLGALGSLVIALVNIPAAWAGFNLGTGTTRYLFTGGFAVLFGVPVIVASMLATKRQTEATDELMDELRTELLEALENADEESARREGQARHQQFESQLTNALEMAANENEVLGVVERAFVATIADAPAELLLADNSHAHLRRMAVSGSASGAPLCGVESPDECPAARRAQVQRFADSDALDACPKLRGRSSGRCCAVCVPVSVMGRTVGVIHVTSEVDHLPSDETVEDLSTLAKQSGARVGVLRMMAESQLQASTDGLTGLLNRRAFENAVRPVWHRADSAVIMADLDNFKHLNDTYGHDTGDRALRTFAETVRATIRERDLVCRHGGEEFAFVLPACSATEASDVARAIAAAVRRNTAAAGLPTVTASFGVVSSRADEDLPAALARADAALLRAKREGRDRVVIDGDAGDSTDEVAMLRAALAEPSAITA